MKVFRVFPVLIGLLFSVQIFSQGIPIGSWRDHLAYNRCIAVTEAGDRIYCATPYSVFFYDKSDQSLNRLSKVNGLSDVGVSSLGYSKEYRTVVIAYTNTNIDLIQNGSFINIPDIKRKPILGNKTINKVIVDGRIAYLCCGFGIVLLDLMKNEIKDTYYIGPEGSPISVFDLTTDGQYFWVATESGIYKALVNSPNLSNYDSWSVDTTITHPDGKFNNIEYFNRKIYANFSSEVFNSDTLYIHDTDGWSYFNETKTPTTNSIGAFGDRIVFTHYDYMDVMDTNLIIVNHVWRYFFGDTNYYPQPQHAIIDKDKEVWIADANQGMLRNYMTYIFRMFKPNGPSSPKVFAMSPGTDRICVVPGGRNITWGNEWTPGALYTFADESWSTVDYTINALMDSLRDFVAIAVDPSNPSHIYGGTWGYGLAEFSNNQLVNVYNGSNSLLRPPSGLDDYEVKIGGLMFDNENNLWIVNANTSNVVVVKRANDEGWYSYNLGNLVSGGSNMDVGELTIDHYNQVWMLLRGNKLLVFNHNNTLGQINDDQAKVLTSSIGNGAIPGSRVRSIATDLEGQVWLGTDEGVAVFYSPENVFTSSNFDAQRIYVTQDGYTQYLLETEAVTAIAVDGSNKKWFGTERAGVFLMSADGTKQLYHFTEENSPLISNNIASIAINPSSGEIFFGTDKGICSFKGFATTGGETNENVYAYPNPVEPGFEGYIAVRGLVKDADVRITDISGSLVYKTRAEGGQASWNGMDFSGRKVSTGVYLVYISNDDGTQTYVTKILFKN